MTAKSDQLEVLATLFHSGSKLTYDKGELIIRPGEVPTHVFFIETGLVKAYDISKYGEENMLIIRKSGEIFPLIWVITGQERHVIYETLSQTVVWRLGREDYLNYLESHPQVLPVVLDMVTEMYRLHSERIINLEYRTARERLVSFLITMSSRFGRQTPDGLMLDVPLRHQDIASSINTSRETTSRELAYLERKGLVMNHQKCLVLRDVEALKRFL